MLLNKRVLDTPQLSYCSPHLLSLPSDSVSTESPLNSEPIFITGTLKQKDIWGGAQNESLFFCGVNTVQYIFLHS